MTIVNDPVCGMEVEVETTPPALTLEHKGVKYYFCGRGCLLDFKDDPERILAPGYKPAM